MVDGSLYPKWTLTRTIAGMAPRLSHRQQMVAITALVVALFACVGLVLPFQRDLPRYVDCAPPVVSWTVGPEVCNHEARHRLANAAGFVGLATAGGLVGVWLTRED